MIFIGVRWDDVNEWGAVWMEKKQQQWNIFWEEYTTWNKEEKERDIR